MQGSILHQPVKDNFVYNNQQKLVFLESSVLDYESSAFRYKKYIAVLKSGKRFEQPKMKDTCWVVLRLFIIVCSWDPIMTGFMKKSLRFKTRKWRRQFVFFRRCHRWVSGATVVVMSETASINIIFAFSQRWSFHYFIWPTARVIVALLRRLHRSR